MNFSGVQVYIQSVRKKNSSFIGLTIDGIHYIMLQKMLNELKLRPKTNLDKIRDDYDKIYNFLF